MVHHLSRSDARRIAVRAQLLDAPRPGDLLGVIRHLTLLYGDRLVGKLDVRSDHASGRLVVTAIHEDAPFSRAMRASFEREILGLGRMLGLSVTQNP